MYTHTRNDLEAIVEKLEQIQIRLDQVARDEYNYDRATAKRAEDAWDHISAAKTYIKEYILC